MKFNCKITIWTWPILEKKKIIYYRCCSNFNVFPARLKVTVISVLETNFGNEQNDTEQNDISVLPPKNVTEEFPSRLCENVDSATLHIYDFLF